MKAISLPDDLDPMRYHDAIVAGKYAVKGHKNTLVAIRPTIAAAFDRYHANRTQLGAMAPDPGIDDAGKEALASCWHKSDALDDLKRDVRAWLGPDNDRCPYCGVGDAYDTFEYYLPKARTFFPEFIVCAYNIIPCCSQCNNPRPWKNSAGERLLLHVYFDEIDEHTEILIATIEMGEPLRASYAVKEEPTTFARAYARHFGELRLASRFRRRSVRYLASLTNTVRSYRDLTIEQHQRRLREQAEAGPRALGVNHFEVATLRAAAESDEFLRYAMDGGA